MLIGSKNVGDIVMINENGQPVEFIVVHKGLPDPMYDISCNGVWVLRKDGLEPLPIAGDVPIPRNNYEISNFNTFLNNDYLNRLDEDLREEMPEVKIPFKKGAGNDKTTGVYSGANGLSCKVFLLSILELGWIDGEIRPPVDGVKLSYFDRSKEDAANAKRVCSGPDGRAVKYKTRTPAPGDDSNQWFVMENGSYESYSVPYYSMSPRPVLILPDYFVIGDNGVVSVNILPVITANMSGDLGTVSDGFAVEYSVYDDDSDTVTVSELLDGVICRRFEAVPDRKETFSFLGNNWLKVTDGRHTATISATDGKDTVTHSVTFSRVQKSLFVTLDEPLEADDVIRFCSLSIYGFLPTDAIMTCEVTNNALDDEPVWEDCTDRVKSGLVYTFLNGYAGNSFAFNFKISVSRGDSGEGGYIKKISGGFE